MTNQTDGVACMTISVSVYFDVIEIDSYSGDQKKAFAFRIVRIPLRRRSKSAKIARRDRKVFSITDWSLRRVFIIRGFTVYVYESFLFRYFPPNPKGSELLRMNILTRFINKKPYFYFIRSFFFVNVYHFFAFYLSEWEENKNKLLKHIRVFFCCGLGEKNP